MVDVAQLVRAPVCGTGGRGFESHLPPHTIYNIQNLILGCSQAVRHQTLTLYRFKVIPKPQGLTYREFERFNVFQKVAMSNKMSNKLSKINF